MPTDGVRKRVLVAGATGRFGELVDVLIARGHTVRAMTRDPSSSAAARLRDMGAKIVIGDFDDPASVERAAAGVDTVFAAGTAHRAGPEGELRHGRNLAAAAASARVPHVVFCSGDGAAPDSPLALFRVKHQIEQQLRAHPGAHTILAPVYFMENLFNPWNLTAFQAGVFPSPIAVDVPLQQVAIADVAALAASLSSGPRTSPAGGSRSPRTRSPLRARQTRSHGSSVDILIPSSSRPPTSRQGCRRSSGGSRTPGTRPISRRSTPGTRR